MPITESDGPVFRKPAPKKPVSKKPKYGTKENDQIIGGVKRGTRSLIELARKITTPVGGQTKFPVIKSTKPPAPRDTRSATERHDDLYGKIIPGIRNLPSPKGPARKGQQPLIKNAPQAPGAGYINKPRELQAKQEGNRATKPAPKIAGNAASPAAVVKAFGAQPAAKGGSTGSRSSSGRGSSVGTGGSKAPATAATTAPKTSTGSKGPSSAETAKKQRDALQAYSDKASAAVKAELAPALNELNRQILEGTSRAVRNRNDAETRGKATQGDLSELYGRLQNRQGELKAESNAATEGYRSNTNANYDQLAASLQGNTADAQSATSAEAARLGFAGLPGAGEASARGARDSSWLQGLAGINRANSLGGTNRMQDSFQQIMGMRQSNAAQEGTMRVGQSMRDTNKSVSDIMFELEQANRGLEGKRSDIEQGRGSKVNQLIEAMQDKDYNRRVETEDRALQNRIAEGRFNMEKQQFAQAQIPQEMSTKEQLEIAELRQRIQANAAKTEEEEMAENLRKIFARPQLSRQEW